MAVPFIIFVACVGVGVFAASRWLPDLPRGAAGSLSFFAVCGLLTSALAVVGLHVYTLVEVIKKYPGLLIHTEVAGILSEILWQSGLLVGVAAFVYTLASLRAGRPAGEQAPS